MPNLKIPSANSQLWDQAHQTCLEFSGDNTLKPFNNYIKKKADPYGQVHRIHIEELLLHVNQALLFGVTPDEIENSIPKPLFSNDPGYPVRVTNFMREASEEITAFLDTPTTIFLLC